MTEVKPFSDIRQQVEEQVDKYIASFFREKAYDVKQAQSWSNKAAEDIIKTVQETVG